MYSFIICCAALIASYFIYGKLIERIVGVDESIETPAYKLRDNIDYMPMPKYKAFLVHFLNIAGLGPIFGAIQGALFGPAAFLWITLGTIFIGAIHDFFSGFLSLRNDGITMPGIISKYLGTKIQKLIAIVIVITGILVASTFATGAAELLNSLTNIPILTLIGIIFGYFFIFKIREYLDFCKSGMNRKVGCTFLNCLYNQLFFKISFFYKVFRGIIIFTILFDFHINIGKLILFICSLTISL